MELDRSTIIFLILICTLKPGVGQFMGIIQTPVLQFNEDSIPFYSCPFNSEVDCIWKVGNQAISISVHHYTWIKDNGSQTTDCSIKGKSVGTPKLNINNPIHNVTCIGIVIRSNKDVELGSSVQLTCLLKKMAKCDWRRNGRIIRIKNRYKYIKNHDGSNAHDCSIQIDNIQEVDLATWKCFNLATDDHDNLSSMNAYYNLSPSNMERPTSYEPEGPLHNTPTESKTKAIELPTIPTSGSEMSQTVLSVLGIVGIVSLIALTIGIIHFLRKYIQVKKAAAQRNIKSVDVSENHIEQTPETIVPATADGSSNSYYNFRASAPVQNQVEDASGYLVPLQLTRKKPSNHDQVKNSKRNDIDDPSNHIYVKVLE